MFTVTSDLSQALFGLMDQGVLTTHIVIAEEHPSYPGEVCFQLLDDSDDALIQQFYTRYRDWISCYCVLNEIYNLPQFVDQLEQDGWNVLFPSSMTPVLNNLQRWFQPLKIEGYDLYPFQQFSLNRAFEQDYWFFNWSTGAGKTFASTAGAKELFDRGEIDLVIACTVSKSKTNFCRFFTDRAGLDAVVNDGTKDKRRKVYREFHQVYVMNYEKLWHDCDELVELITDKRVLYIFDEASKIVTGNRQNKARQFFEYKLMKVSGPSKIWPMSATVVNGDPLRFWDIFGVGISASSGPRWNPLGLKQDFVNRYADEVRRVEKKVPGKPYGIQLTYYEWSLTRLSEVRHRVGGLTQSVRKSDPGIAPLFKGMQRVIEPVQMAPETTKVAQAITDLAWEAYQRQEGLGPYYALLRYLCNTALALLHTEHEVAQEIAASLDLTKLPNTKLDTLNEHLESIREQGDKALVFTHWTNLTLHLIKDQITVPYVLHYGVGQSNKESQAAQDRFQSDPDITVFLTSDAGSHGLNMQCARYCIEYEPTYSFDDSMQRSSRIDRADSHLDGLTSYTYVTEGSVEERVMQIQNDRRLLSEAVQGTTELPPTDIARAQRSESDNYRWLLFGDRSL